MKPDKAIMKPTTVKTTCVVSTAQRLDSVQYLHGLGIYIHERELQWLTFRSRESLKLPRKSVPRAALPEPSRVSDVSACVVTLIAARYIDIRTDRAAVMRGVEQHNTERPDDHSALTRTGVAFGGDRNV
jgi:hypothetical protein